MLWVLLAVPIYGLLGRLPNGGRQKGDASDWSSRDWDLTAGAYQPQVSFTFGLMSPSLVQTANMSTATGSKAAEVKSGDGLSMQTQSTQSLSEGDAAGLAFRGTLPAGLEPCDHSVVHVQPGELFAVEPNRLATPCYRFVVNQEVHTLQVLALPGASAQSPGTGAEYDRKHTFAIRVSEVDPARTRTNYDARTGSFDVQLFPSSSSAPEMSFTQIEDASLLAHRYVPTLEAGSGMSVTASSGAKLVA